MQFSKYQESIFNFVETGKGSAVVIAVAGSGKTTTIVEAAKRIPASQFCTFVAFNKSIAEELGQKLPKHVQAKTLNALGYGAWYKHTNKRLELDTNKTRNVVRALLNEEEQELYGTAITKLVSLAKTIGLVPRGRKEAGLVHDTDEQWLALIEKYDVDIDEEASAERLLELSRTVLARCIEESYQVRIDFDDQLYMPVIARARFFQNDWLFVDEAQDVNAVQRAMLKRALKIGGRLIAVGDPSQAIYGFRGADTDAIDNIKREFNAIELPLTISYRCPKNVVKEAQTFVQHIEASETAADGKVETLEEFAMQSFDGADAILCRNTAPLIEAAYKLLRARVACRVLGREIGQGLTALVKKMKARGVEALEEKLASYVERECAKFIAKGQEQKAEALVDRVDTIRVFIEQLEETKRTVPALIESIERLFTDNNKGVLTLCTVHKSKGLEFPRVFILNRELMPSKWARQQWQQQQETNLQYVAVTRAKSELYYISSKGLK